jgi:hypothetical protein
MRYWLLRRPPHYSEIHPSSANTPWDYDKVFVDVRLKAGDVVYLMAAHDELYGWGHVIKRESYQDAELQRRAYKVIVNRPVVQQDLVSSQDIKRLSELMPLFSGSDRNLVPLTARQVNAFNRLISSKGVVAPANLESDEPQLERIPKQDFPRVPLTPEVAKWLEAAYARLRHGKNVDPTEMLVELWSNLPEDFEYGHIDNRLMRFGIEPTLLGILHVDPATELIEETDQVIRFVRELILREPGIRAITSEEVSEGLTLPEEDVALIFTFLSHLGDFWNGGAGYGDRPGQYSVTIADEKVKREYLRYKNIDDLLVRLGEQRSGRNTSESSTSSAIVSSGNSRYDVCLSFAGEDRKYVERVAATLLAAGIVLFYDKYEQVSLWGKDLYQHLSEVYRKQARYCVIFISKSYSEKLWTKHELRSAQARAFEDNREYILPVRLDETELPGVLPTIGYISNKSPEDLADLIICKLQDEEGPSARKPTNDTVQPDAPTRLRDGTNATAEQRAAFSSVWHSLLELEKAGQTLWEHVSGEALAAFADIRREAEESIGLQALFFSEDDYDNLQRIMKAANFYLNGKTRLSDIYNGQVETEGLDLVKPSDSDRFVNEEVRDQIQQNKRWLTRYRNLLQDIRVRLHSHFVS